MSVVVLSPPMKGNHFTSGSELVILKAKSKDLVIAGYASVDVVDKQNDLITLEALREASDAFMKSDYKNVMITHSNVQVGEVLDSWTDSTGNVLKTGCDDTGFFVVIKMRNDIEKAREVGRDIRRGTLRSFSIGGQAMHKANRHDPDVGTYKEIDKLELHEVTICEEGINPEAKFEIIKENKNKGDEKMSEEINKALSEFNDIVGQLREQVQNNIMKEDSDEEVEYQSVEEEEEVLMAESEDDDEEMMDVADEEKKAESVAYGHNPTGQKRIDGALVGRYESEFSDFLARKSETINTLDLSHENLAKAYAQFKAEQEEARAYEVIKNEFTSMYAAEINAENDAVAKSKYDAASEVETLKGQFAELRKSLVSNNAVIAKQVEAVNSTPAFSEDMVMKMQNLHELTWDEVEQLVREVRSA
tara:strand:+ start:3212 stop:4465 length:1254 start_codon:yes stop_codon:yes gene_type:complete